MSDISQTELLESNNDSLQMKIHTALPARVVSFNADEQTVIIEVMIQQMDYNGNSFNLPPLVDVPVQMFSYGPFSITATPTKGDEGLAHFSERCIDGWWESSKKSVPLDVRFHDLSDAFFAGGYKSKPNALTIVPNALNVGSSGAYVRIYEDGRIEIKGETKFLDKVTAPDFTTDSGISLDSHIHGNVQNGDGTTGNPK